MKYCLFYLMLLLLCTSLNAQTVQPTLEQNGIYAKDSDYLHHHLTNGFDNKKNYKLNDNKKNFLLVKRDSVTEKYYYDDIWGYRKNGVDWRIYNNDYYKVDYAGKIWLYEMPGYGASEGARVSHYFSRSASGAIHPITKKNLIDAYHDRTEFVNKIHQLPLTRSIFKWDKEHNNFLFVSWL